MDTKLQRALLLKERRQAMYFSTRNLCRKTIRGMIAEYEKAWRLYEKQRVYEKGIVCSVPVREIGPEQDIIPATDWWKPG